MPRQESGLDCLMTRIVSTSAELNTRCAMASCITAVDHQGSGFRVEGLGLRTEIVGLRVWGLRFRVSGSRFRVCDLGKRACF